MFTRFVTPLLAILLCGAAHSPSSSEQTVSVESGSGRIITLSAPAASVFAADPKVVEVRPASPTSLFLFGVGPGRTTVAAMSSGGQLIAQLNVTVASNSFSATSASNQIAHVLPGNAMVAEVRPNGLVLSGEASNPRDAELAEKIGRSNLGDKQKLDDRIKVAEPVQVNLRVRVVEMGRNLTRELGVNWQALANIGGRYGALGYAAAPQLVTAATSAFGAGYNMNSIGKALDINTVIDALAQDALVHVLAEPNLTTMSGEPASFLVGGEFPIPIAQFGNTISVDFKQYGVSLSFVPTVLSNGRINLHVRPEVSQLTNQGAFQSSNGVGGTTVAIPGLQVRRADTTVELGSGQSFAIAGLLQDSTSITQNGTPFLGDIPILGALFRSDSFQRNETELVIIVTPYLVQPVINPAALATPDDSWRPPNDLERILLLRQKARGASGSTSRPSVPGETGFLIQ